MKFFNADYISSVEEFLKCARKSLNCLITAQGQEVE